MDRLITTYEQAIEFLYGRINYERILAESVTAGGFKLERMKDLLARLGNPHLEIPAVHIAGTKGKGTTAAIAASILEAAGYRVGLFTSPHITSFEERIQVNGRMPDEADVVSLVGQVAEISDEMDRVPGQMSPTFFEITMAIGWLWFRRQNVDLAVLEVGLGGRLDATNVCRSIVCAITSISRDHTALLGNTLEEIAREKAGIIKPGVPLVCGVEDGPALKTIQGIADERGSAITVIDREIQIETAAGYDPREVTIGTQRNTYERLELPFAGRHQFRNAAVAIGLIEEVKSQGWPVAGDAFRRGVSQARCPLRIEVVRREPTVVLDVAHNWASITALLETLNRDFARNRRILIFAASRDKDAAGMLRLLLSQFTTVIVTQFLGNPRALPVEKTARLARSLTSRMIHAANTPAGAWQLARRLAGTEDLIAGTGSFFIAAELREIILGVDSASEASPVEGRQLNEKSRQH